MKGHTPAARTAELKEAAEGRLDVLFGTDRVGKRQRAAATHAVGDEATVCLVEEVGLVGPQLEEVERRAPVLFEDARGAESLLRERAEAVDDGAEEGEPGVDDRHEGEKIDGACEPEGLRRLRRKARVSDERDDE